MDPDDRVIMELQCISFNVQNNFRTCLCRTKDKIVYTGSVYYFSFYSVKNGVFRQYMGGRTETDLITFIDDKKWSSVEPVSKWTSPESLQ